MGFVPLYGETRAHMLSLIGNSLPIARSWTFAAFRTVRNKWLLFEPHSLWYFFIAAPAKPSKKKKKKETGLSRQKKKQDGKQKRKLQKKKKKKSLPEQVMEGLRNKKRSRHIKNK